MLERTAPPVDVLTLPKAPTAGHLGLTHGIANFVTDLLPVPGQLPDSLLHEATQVLPRGLATPPPTLTGDPAIDIAAQRDYSNARAALELHSKRMETLLPIMGALTNATEIIGRFGSKKVWTATVAAGLCLTNVACAYAMEASGGDEGGGAGKEVIQVNASGYDSETGTPQQQKELNEYAVKYMPGAIDPFTMYSTLEDDGGRVVKEDIFLADEKSGETKTIRKATDGTVRIYETTQNVDPETGEKLIIGYQVDENGNPIKAEVLERYKLNGNIVVIDEQATEEPFKYKGEPQQLQFKSNGAVIPLGVGKRAYEVALSKGARIKTAISNFFDRLANKAQASDQADAVITGTPTPENTAQPTATKAPATNTPNPSKTTEPTNTPKVTKVAVVPPQGGGEQTEVPPTITPPPTDTPPATDPPPPTDPPEATAGATQVAQVVNPPVEPTSVTIENPGSDIEIAVLHNYTGEVEGIPFNFNLGLGKDITERSDRPFSDIALNTDHWDTKYGTGTAANRVASAIAKGHYLGYLEEHPGISFSDYLNKLKNGEDVTYSIAVSVPGSVLEKKTVKIDPNKPVNLIVTDEYGGMTVRPKSADFPGASIKYTVDFDGSLTISAYLSSFLIKDDPINAPVVSGQANQEISTGLARLGWPIDFQRNSKSEADIVTYGNDHTGQYQEIQDTLLVKGEKPAIRVTEK